MARTISTQETIIRIRKSEDGIIKGHIGWFEEWDHAQGALAVIAGMNPIDGHIARFEENGIKYEYVIELVNLY